MKKNLKRMIAGGAVVVFAGFMNNCILISDLIGVDPIGGLPVETVVRQAAGKAAQGWMFGCEAALQKYKSDLIAEGGTFTSSTNCIDNSVTDGGEGFAAYATAARNAANNLIPVMKEKQHAYYVESSVEECLNVAFTNAYLYTKLYLDGEFSTNGVGKFAEEPEFAISTFFGVQGTAACAEELVGTGRVIAIGDLNL